MNSISRVLISAVCVFTCAAFATVAKAQTAPKSISKSAPKEVVKPLLVKQDPIARVDRIETGPVDIGPSMSLTVGKSTLLRLPKAIERISIGNPQVADVTLISNRELYLIGKTFGSTNVMLWHQGGGTTVLDMVVQIDTASLQEQMRLLLPTEKRIEVKSASESIVLSGSASSALRVTEAMDIAEGFIRAYSRSLNLPNAANTLADAVAQGGRNAAGAAPPVAAGGARGLVGQPKVINLLKIDQPMQVMIDVKIAEVARTVIDKLGASVNGSRSNGDIKWSLISSLSSLSSSGIGLSRQDGRGFSLDAQKQDGVVKILAEPSLVAISGQEASFLAGGKIFIPVAQENRNGGTTITLQEKEYGVSLKFLPVVLDKGNISLQIAPEVSELVQAGNPFSSVNGVTSILPGFTTRRANTSVILGDGQSLAIAGLIKNNVTETIKKFPGLGELPILGALFRSTEFEADRSELLIVITPRLIKALDAEPALPTDAFLPAGRGQIYGRGALEGKGNQDVPLDRKSQPKLELK
jgi:pilus assembly protein CpaC